jgi:hypothetical protein
LAAADRVRGNEKLPLFLEGVFVVWRLGGLTSLAKTGVLAGLFAFSDYSFEEISRSEIEGIGGCYGWS